MSPKARTSGSQKVDCKQWQRLQSAEKAKLFLCSRLSPAPQCHNLSLTFSSSLSSHNTLIRTDVPERNSRHMLLVWALTF